MKIEIDLKNTKNIQRNIDAVEKAIVTPEVGAHTSVLLIDVKCILIMIKEVAAKEDKETKKDD